MYGSSDGIPNSKTPENRSKEGTMVELPSAYSHLIQIQEQIDQPQPVPHVTYVEQTPQQFMQPQTVVQQPVFSPGQTIT